MAGAVRGNQPFLTCVTFSFVSFFVLNLIFLELHRSQQQGGASGIVYTLSRKDSEQVASYLRVRRTRSLSTLHPYLVDVKGSIDAL